MHEMGVTAGIIEAAVDAAEQAGATRITRIELTVGEFTEVVEEALRFAFDALAPGTLAEGAELAVNMVSALSRCSDCGVEFSHERFEMTCPECGSIDLEALRGRELQIDSIEVDDGLSEDEADVTAEEAR